MHVIHVSFLEWIFHSYDMDWKSRAQKGKNSVAGRNPANHLKRMYPQAYMVIFSNNDEGVWRSPTSFAMSHSAFHETILRWSQGP